MVADVIWRRLAGPLVALLIFGGVGELAVRLYTRHHLIYDVEMTRYALGLKIDAPSPAISHVHRPGGSMRLMGVDITINSDGLRDREYTVARTAGDRVEFLGDSLTLGWGVQQADTFENLIEEQVNVRRPTEILNFGIGNFNTTQEAALFEARGLKYHPDKVVLFYFLNDAEPTAAPSRWGGLGHLEFATVLWSRARAIASRFSPVGDYRAYYSSLYDDRAPGWEAAKRALISLDQVCREHRIALQVVILPELHELRAYPFTREHALISAALEALHIQFLDLAPKFSDVVDPRTLWVAPDDAHPNAIAHRRIAEYVLPFVFPDIFTAQDAEALLAKE